MASMDVDNTAMIMQTPDFGVGAEPDVQQETQDVSGVAALTETQEPIENTELTEAIENPEMTEAPELTEVNKIQQMPRAGTFGMFGADNESFGAGAPEDVDKQMLDLEAQRQQQQLQDLEKQKIENYVRQHQLEQQQIQNLQATKYVDEMADIGQLQDMLPKVGLDDAQAVKDLTERREKRFDAIMKMIDESNREFDSYKRKYTAVMTKHVVAQPSEMLSILQMADNAAASAKHGINEATKFIMDYDAFIFAPPEETEDELRAKIIKQQQKQNALELPGAQKSEDDVFDLAAGGGDGDTKGRAGIDLTEFDDDTKTSEQPEVSEKQERDERDKDKPELDERDERDRRDTDDDDLLDAAAAGPDIDEDMLDEMF